MEREHQNTCIRSSTTEVGVNTQELDLGDPEHLRCKSTVELLPDHLNMLLMKKPRLKKMKGHSTGGVSQLDMWPPATGKTRTRT